MVPVKIFSPFGDCKKLMASLPPAWEAGYNVLIGDQYIKWRVIYTSFGLRHEREGHNPLKDISLTCLSIINGPLSTDLYNLTISTSQRRNSTKF